MQFEVGKFYRMTTGHCMAILGAVRTTTYGWTLVAEEWGSGQLKPVGQGAEYTDNWKETSEEYWLSGFSSDLNGPASQAWPTMARLAKSSLSPGQLETHAQVNPKLKC